MKLTEIRLRRGTEGRKGKKMGLQGRGVKKEMVKRS